jgi:hypothetical protein
LRIFNLTHCLFRTDLLNFDEFEIFIRKISSQLRVLSFTPTAYIAYLDADRWERLISQHIPYLHTFQFDYSDALFGRSVYQPYRSVLHRFTSTFWIEKGWMFGMEMNLSHGLPNGIVYSIRPHKYV